MSLWNTTVSEFVLSSLSSDPSLQLPVFLLCLLVYLVTLLGNFLMILLILVTPGLQLPMYIFLMNLSLIDILYSSAITPNAIVIIFSVRKTISIIGCATQMFLFIDLASSEGMLLAVMAYDRYAAICKPLYYTSLINKASCLWLIFSVHTIGFINSLIHTCFAFTLPFCKSNKVNHFFCDANPILKLSCKDIFLNQVLAYVVAGSIEVGSLIYGAENYEPVEHNYILYSSAITPNAMIIMFSVRKTISIIGCATQMFLFIDLASSEVRYECGSVMVWRFMSAASIGDLQFIEGTMNVDMCWDILKQSTIPSLQKLAHTPPPPTTLISQLRREKGNFFVSWMLYSVA
ncbi:olfactory receptor-like protein COR4 [Hyperolius riggenbachi]|uniref:olfactory receptor-like protein COR4 n=1 Tax=Hyperolius riggenbachi TaxID=752182 RepID=UPI0035A37C7D